MITCPECGGSKLSWDKFTMRNGMFPEMSTTYLFLGCDECSETVLTQIALDDAITFLNEQQWRP